MENLEKYITDLRMKFDTESGLKQYLSDSTDKLAAVHEIINARKELVSDFRIELTNYMLGNKFIFDKFGQVCKVFDFNIREYPEDFDMQGFNDFAFLRAFYNLRVSYSVDNNFPKPEDICPRCGNKWKLHEILEYPSASSTFTYKEDKFYHEECWQNYVDQNYMDDFKATLRHISEAIGQKWEWTMISIPNLYGSRGYKGQWYIINTDFGSIRFGWRKRVIEIEWKPNFKEFDTSIFDNENVTKKFKNGERYIHAYGYNKMEEYIIASIKNIVAE